MTPTQTELYKHFAKMGMKKLKSDTEGRQTGGQDSLKAMIHLKKIVNHPCLLSPSDVPPSLLPDDFSFKERCQVEWSGKIIVLDNMIRQMRVESSDKIVVISNYTQTLDLVERLCGIRKWPLFRLDGSMQITKRQKMVDQFNDLSTPQFVFLLSSKAGGCGINLIGANRLILFGILFFL